MGGGLMQLVAYGAQDVYLTGNPQITFFKVVYRRHTNFSMEAIEQTLNGTIALGNKVSCTISRNGDLVHRVYLQVDLVGAGAASNYGHALIKNVDVEIGGQRIDRHTGEWLHVWNELTQEEGKKEGYNQMVGNTAGSDVKRTIYVPLQFWFCRNAGLALPLIALQYHEVKINIDFAQSLGTFEKVAAKEEVLEVEEVGDLTETDPAVYVVTTPGVQAVPAVDAVMGGIDMSPNAKLFVDYIYLDTDERRRFAQISHEYLIEQLQYTGGEVLKANTEEKVKLNFNHPVKCLVWTVKDSTDDHFAFEPHGVCGLKLNGHERFSPRDGTYFSLVQPYQHMPNVPSTSAPINMYSFGLKPAEHQPSGTCNMSRIDNAQLSLKSAKTSGNDQTLNVYAVNYNVLRIMSGMGGLAYSN
tara:strand:+ start:4873 stop:6108 length:1236 start_codon:yes stop_codon:yes gene_type:complete